jgi:hypothetical protein
LKWKSFVILFFIS